MLIKESLDTKASESFKEFMKDSFEGVPNRPSSTNMGAVLAVAAKLAWKNKTEYYIVFVNRGGMGGGQVPHISPKSDAKNTYRMQGGFRLTPDGEVHRGSIKTGDEPKEASMNKKLVAKQLLTLARTLVAQDTTPVAASKNVVAGEPDYEKALEMIKSSEKMAEVVMKQAKSIVAELEYARRDAAGLEKVGSANIEAPKLLKKVHERVASMKKVIDMMDDSIKGALGQEAKTASVKTANKFLVKYDFAKFQPQWGAKYIEKFGKNNEGFELEADNLEKAKELLKTKYNFNPFYVKFEEKK